MDRYEDYKDSGVSWLDEVPTHWRIRKLGTLLSEVSLKGYSEKQLLSITREKGVIVRGAEDQDDNHNFIPDDLSGYKLITQGQFGMNKMKAWQGSYGVSSYEGIVSPAYYVFKIAPELQPEFFNWAIRSKFYVTNFGAASDGVRIGQWDLSKVRMRNIPFLIPPSEEQQSIADFLDEKTAKIDQAIAIKEKEIQLLKERRQILIQELVTGKKVWDGSSWAKPTETKDSGVDWIGEIPKHWEVRKLKYTIKKAYSGGTPSTDNSRYWDGGIPWVSSVDVKTDKLSKTSREISVDGLKHSSAKIAPAGSLVFVTRSGILQHTLPVAILLKDMAINQDIKCILFQRYISATFFRYLLNGNNDEILNLIRQQAATVESIDMDAFFNLQVPILPITEQDKIVQKCTAVDSEYQKIIALKHTEIQKLKEYKTVLINDVVTGKLRVHAGSGKQLTKGPVYS